MGLFDKFLDVMKLNDDDDDIYDEELDDYYEDEENDKPLFGKSNKAADKDSRVKEEKKSTKITPLRSVKRNSASDMEIFFIRPTSYEDVKEITETLLDNRTVIMNMEGLDLALAQRIIDFTSGSCYAIDGSLQKISNYMFVLTPSSVDISGDFQDIMGMVDISGIQTGF